MNIAKQIQKAAKEKIIYDEEFDRVQLLIYKNKNLIKENFFGKPGEGSELYIFTDNSNILLEHADICSGLKDYHEINISKKRLELTIKEIKAEKEPIKYDAFYSTCRDWTDHEMDIYL